MISSAVLSPTASSFLAKGAFVQPHPGFTLRIFRESSPTDFIQNVWEIFEFCGANPKLKLSSGKNILDCAIAWEINKTKNRKRAAVIRNDFFTACLQSAQRFPFIVSFGPISSVPGDTRPSDIEI